MRTPLVLLFGLVLLTACSNSKTGPVATIDYYAEEQDQFLNALITDIYNDSKVPILYFYADWCKPCWGFRESLEDPRVQAALSHATLIKIDVDRDLEGDEVALQYGVRAVPTYVKVTPEGKITAKITSAEWAENVPENIAPVMEQLVNGEVYDR